MFFKVFVNFAKYQTDGFDNDVIHANPASNTTVGSPDDNVRQNVPEVKVIGQKDDYKTTKISFDDVLWVFSLLLYDCPQQNAVIETSYDYLNRYWCMPGAKSAFVVFV